MLNESIGFHELLEILPSHKVVLATILLARAGSTGGVRDAKPVAVGVLSKQALEESGLAGA